MPAKPTVIEIIYQSNRLHVVARIKSAGPLKPIPEFPVILGDFELLYLEEDRPKVSCCYGVSVFAGLALALVVLTSLVVYAGFWFDLQRNGMNCT